MPDPSAANRSGLLKRALVIWLVLIAVEFIHGIVRAIFLVPVVGEFRARQIGVFIGSVFIIIVAYLFVGWLNAPNRKALIQVGVLWLVVTVAFEFRSDISFSEGRGQIWRPTTIFSGVGSS